MSEPISIFVCHKKRLSHAKAGDKTGNDNVKASVLHEILQSCPDRYKPWIDESEIAAGMKWETEIYDKLLISDVLLVAIGPGTSASEWVKREISLATALGIGILPVGYDQSQDEFGSELKALGIGHIQGHLTTNIKFSAKDALLRELATPIRRAADSTAREQASKLAPLTARRNPRIAKAPDAQRAFTRRVELSGSAVDLHVASGDLTRTVGIDVLVNSENDYMQMARFFESHTVSSRLRTKGARISNGKYVDLIQQELDLQVGDRARPVQPAELFITSAGVPDSKLARENKARYILHVASVQAVAAERRVVPFKQPEQIEDCVESCFQALMRINQLNGVISPQGTEQRVEQERLASVGSGTVGSILFPLFGSGQGGESASHAIQHMLAGLKRFFNDASNDSLASRLTDIYFAAYSQTDADAVIGALQSHF